MCGLIVVFTAVCLFVVVFKFLLQLFIDVVSLLANEFVVFDVDIALCSFTPCSFSFLLFLFVFVCLFVLLLLLLLFWGVNRNKHSFHQFHSSSQLFPLPSSRKCTVGLSARFEQLNADYQILLNTKHA